MAPKKKKAIPKKKKKEEIPLLPKQIGVWVWAQCDNAGCQKWRKLPPGTVVNDNEPWFCYMNPNEDQNDCNIPEEEYNITTEAAVYSLPQSQAQSGDSDEEDSYSWHSEDESRGKRPKRSSQPARGQANRRIVDDNVDLRNTLRSSDAGSMFQQIDSTPALAPEAEDDGAMWREVSQTKAKVKKAHTAFNKLLSSGGVWELPKVRDKPPVPLPGFVWEGLAAHAPDSARIACQATDLCSATRYFELAQEPSGELQSQKARETARLALTMASALALDATSQLPGVYEPQSQAHPLPNNYILGHADNQAHNTNGNQLQQDAPNQQMTQQMIQQTGEIVPPAFQQNMGMDTEQMKQSFIKDSMQAIGGMQEMNLSNHAPPSLPKENGPQAQLPLQNGIVPQNGVDAQLLPALQNGIDAPAENAFLH